MIDPYSKITTVDFWTDKYISKNMLKAHLDPSTDAASRKPVTIKKTVDFIKSIVPKNKTICDFGCGPGLYTNLLQKEGYTVIGADVSETSLNYAKKTNKNVEYIKMNYVSSKLPKKVNFAMMIYCDFGALDPASQVKTLKNIKGSLSSDGLFFFDVMSHNYFDKQKEQKVISEETDGFFMKGHCKVTSRYVKYPKLKLLLAHHHASGYKEVDYYNWDKCYDETEMKALLEENGFEILNTYSNTYGDKDYTTDDTLSFLCKRKAQ